MPLITDKKLRQLKILQAQIETDAQAILEELSNPEIVNWDEVIKMLDRLNEKQSKFVKKYNNLLK